MASTCRRYWHLHSRFQQLISLLVLSISALPAETMALWHRYSSARTMSRMCCESATGCRSFLSRMRALSGWRRKWMLSMSWRPSCCRSRFRSWLRLAQCILPICTQPRYMLVSVTLVHQPQHFAGKLVQAAHLLGWAATTGRVHQLVALMCSIT